MAIPTTYVNPNQTLAAGGLEGAATNVLTAIFWNRLAAMVHYLGGTAGYIGCRAYNSAAISIANGTPTNLTFNSERFDTDPNGAIHDTSSNTDRLVCRTAGVYLITGHVEWAANTSGHRVLQILHSSGVAIATVDHTASATPMQSIATAYLLAASEYVTLQVTQDSGGALNVAATAARSPEFAIVKL